MPLLETGIPTATNPPPFYASISLANAQTFCDITAPQQDQFMADLAAAALARERAIMGATHASQNRKRLVLNYLSKLKNTT
jgi:hypothetical protein